MNKVMLMGRLTRDPEVRISQSQSGDQMTIGRFSIAVDRRFNRNSIQRQISLTVRLSADLEILLRNI